MKALATWPPELSSWVPKLPLAKAFLGSPLQAMHTCLVLVPAWLAVNLTYSGAFVRHPDTFAWFIQHGSTPQWITTFVLLALTGSVGLFFDNRWARLGSATVLGMGHALIACGFYLSNPESLSMGVYVIWAILAAWRIYLE